MGYCQILLLFYRCMPCFSYLIHTCAVQCALTFQTLVFITKRVDCFTLVVVDLFIFFLLHEGTSEL